MPHFPRLAQRIIFTILICFCGHFVLALTEHSRQQRALPLMFYRNVSVLQFVCGFGIPVQDLDLETITSGMVFKCNYGLPASLHDLTPHTTHSINARNDEESEHQEYAQKFQNFFESRQQFLSKYRWTAYTALELMAENLGYPGRACVLKSICEAAEVPFHYDTGLLGELAHILLTPSTSNDDELSSMYNGSEYLNAEHLGRNGVGCDRIFQECPKSILEQFSHIFNFSNDVIKTSS